MRVLFCDVSNRENRKYLSEREREPREKVGDGGTDGECGSQADGGKSWIGRKGSSDGTEEGDSVPGSLWCPEPAAILLLHQLNTSHSL